MRLDPKEQEIVLRVEVLANQVIRPKAELVDRSGLFPFDLYQRMAETGILGMAVPSRYDGGLGLSMPVQVRVTELMGGACSTCVGALIGNAVQAAIPILKGGSEDICCRYLPEMIKGRMQCALAITESSAGSDVAAMQTRAEQTAGGWRLYGEKVMINRSPISHYAVVFATVDPTRGSRGVTGFLVHLNHPGVILGPPMEKMGQRGLPTGNITFGGLMVSDDHVLGGIGGGFKLLMQSLTPIRLIVAVSYVGRMAAAFKFARDYALERTQFGRPLAQIESVRMMLADMTVQIEAGRALAYRAAEELQSKGENATLFVSIAKLFATDACMKVTTDAVQVYGGKGYMVGCPAERLMRDAKAGQILDGTNQIHRLIIARELLNR
jgi:alkylation response protein AidB-like acyl-CoA dehydrogenase